MEITYKIAETQEEFNMARNLVEEYVISLQVDLSFQQFDNEMETITIQYNKPTGALIIAFYGTDAVGCVGIRRFEDEIAELKRMYVQNKYRGYGIGVGLLERSIELAKGHGYKRVRLDTLENMTKAQQLYRSFGFYEIPSYRFNPLKGTVYMEKDLLLPM